MKQNFKLDDLPKQKIYPVPELYFEKLPASIMARVTAKPAGSGVFGWLNAFQLLRVSLAGAGLVVSFISVFWLAQNHLSLETNGQIPVLSALSHQEIIQYVTNQADLDNRDLAQLSLADTDLTPEFMNAATDDILQVIDNQPIEEVYF